MPQSPLREIAASLRQYPLLEPGQIAQLAGLESHHSDAAAYLRFDLAGLRGRKVEDATLLLTGFNIHPAKQDVNLFALQPGDYAGDWSETKITWANAPANLEEGGGAVRQAKPNSGGVDHGRASFLGTLSIRKTKRSGDEFPFNSPRLVEFLNSAEAGTVTFILTAVDEQQKQDTSFATRENTAGLAPPRLRLRLVR
jgi:hypothetical protein